MSKHLRTKIDIDYINHAMLRDEKIIHIKTTPSKCGKTHFYWNKNRAELIVGSKIVFPVVSLAHLDSCKESCFDCDRNEIQLGDSVVWFFGKSIQPVVCATVTGVRITPQGKFFRLLPNHTRSVVPETWAWYDPDRFFFVTNNKCRRYRARPNIIFAAFQDELDKVEEIYAPIRTDRIVYRYLTNGKLSLGEKAFRECHAELFKGIYEWAGVYRTIEVVITDRNFPTLHPSEIAARLKAFCHDFSNRYLRLIGNNRQNMLNALVFAHTELAWIHPFEDGNGRAIRLYLELVAKTRGFGFDLSAAMRTKKQKRYYHFAVRKAVEGYSRHLTALLNTALV